MKSSLVSGSKPRSIAVADLNNDHLLDIVVANSGTNSIGIFLAQDYDNFNEQIIYSTGSNSLPYSVTIDDFNNDSHLDIVVANYGTNNIVIFLGYGNGSFHSFTTISLGPSRPIFVTTADFNNDHQSDIAVINYGTNSFAVLLGYGNASFQNYEIYSTGYDSFPCSLVVGHFNNDSHSDIAVVNSHTNNIGIFLGIGNGSFHDQQLYSTLIRSNPSSIAAGDLNNDRYLDLVVSNNGSRNIGIFFGNGDGTFQQIHSITSNFYPQYVSVGRLNEDNHLDIVVVDSINDRIHILRGLGNGTFDVITTYDGIKQSYPFYVALADLNKNNQTDIVVANYGTNNILLLSDYFVTLSARQTLLLNAALGNTPGFTVGDLNNDHIPDIIFISNNTLYVSISLDSENFVATANYSIGSILPQYMYSGDVNNDNQTDIIVANIANHTVHIFLGDGNGTLYQMLTYSTGIKSQPSWLGLGDFNDDNAPDIVSANTGSRSVGILLGHGNGLFDPVIIYNMTSGFNPYSVAIGYIDGDNYLDFAVCDDGHMISIFLGLGNGSFYIETMFEVEGEGGTFLFSIALADFNNDNYLDIVVANTWSYQITIFVGYGNGTFHLKESYFTGSNSQPYYVIVNDFNNDHIKDIATSNFGTNEILIFFGYENGSFELGRNYSTDDGSAPYIIAAADFDDDQQLEIVVELSGTRRIVILAEYHAARFKSIKTFSNVSAPQLYSVAVGKCCNDQRSLIVTANSGTDNLNLLFVSNNGTSDMIMTYSTGENSKPEYVITCDINNDQQLDIVSVNAKSNSISVILGNENGTFENQITYSTGDGSHPIAITSSDLNNDTRLDLIIANADTDEIGIFYGFNYTTFHPYTSYSSDQSLQPTGVVVSDFNNDSYLDIAATFLGSNSIGILLGYGNGSFSDITTYSTGIESSPQYLGIGDFNNDNKTDIIVANSNSSNIGIFLGYGNGNFVNMMTYSTGEKSCPVGIAIGDLDNDSRLDIVVANVLSNNIGVLLGYGNGSFSDVELYSTQDGSWPISVAIADMNSDYRLDIVVANFGDDSVSIFFGYGNGTFDYQHKISTGQYTQPSWINVGDFNRDNQSDIAVVLRNSNQLKTIFGPVNKSSVDFFVYSTNSNSESQFIYTDDFNQDTFLDIAVVNGGTNDVVIYFGFGDGDFLEGRSFSTGDNSSPDAMTIGDFNHDFRLDIIVANYISNNIVVFLGKDDEPFGSILTFRTGIGSQPHSIAIGECNNDGQMDIIVASYGTNNIAILLGDSNMLFKTMLIHSTGIRSSPYSLAVADMNNDKNLDIAVTNSQSNTVMILFGIGNGSFIEGMIYSTGDQSRPYQIVLHDMNNDHLLDLIIANSGTNNILIIYGLGNGTFGNTNQYNLGYGYEPYSIAVSDINNDGRMDIAVACYATDHVEILLGPC